LMSPQNAFFKPALYVGHWFLNDRYANSARPRLTYTTLNLERFGISWI
jgi:hypothetical protein